MRYEDLCLKMNETVNKLLDFLDISRHELIEKFISTNTHYTPEHENPYSTQRNSKYIAFDWRNHIKTTDLSELQMFCEKPMKILGYNAIKNISNNKDDHRYPFLLDPTFKLTR